jgi:hypothetical protein
MISKLPKTTQNLTARWGLRCLAVVFGCFGTESQPKNSLSPTKVASYIIIFIFIIIHIPFIIILFIVS